MISPPKPDERRVTRRRIIRMMVAAGISGASVPFGAVSADAAESNKPMPFTTHQFENTRTRISWIEAGPSDGPLMMFVHGWPELGLIWRPQIEFFCARGWRCVAPDIR